MKKVVIFFKGNSVPLSMAVSPQDAEIVFNDIAQARKNPEVNTLVLASPSGKVFIDPHDVSRCEISAPAA